MKTKYQSKSKNALCRMIIICMTFMLLCLNLSAQTYSYYLTRTGPTNTDYVYPGVAYSYTVTLSPTYQGSLSIYFDVSLENGTLTGSIPPIGYLVGEQIYVVWNDLQATAKITITAKNFGSISLQAGRNSLSASIASLKGQIPDFWVSPDNVSMGETNSITASVSQMYYPTIYENNTNKKVVYYEWTLPDHWKTASGDSGVFITMDKTITISPDKYTATSIKVRGMNNIESSGSEYSSILFNRNFSYTSFPNRIICGDLSYKTFSTTFVSNTIYEWSVPNGWIINGQGNTISGNGLNTVTITPSFCEGLAGDVRVRLKNNSETGNWITCPYSGVTQPYIIAPTTIYQYECAHFTIGDISTESIDSIIWSQNGTYYSSKSYGEAIILSKKGTVSIGAKVYINGCNNPIIIDSTPFTVVASRLSISGPSQICDQGAYSLQYFSSCMSVTWRGLFLSIASGQGSSQVTANKTKNTASDAAIYADIIFDNKIVGTISKTGIKIGTQKLSFSVFDANGEHALASPYYTNIQYTISARGDGIAYEPSGNFLWEVYPPSGFMNMYQGYLIPFFCTTAGTYTVKLKYYNASKCGWSEYNTQNIYVRSGRSGTLLLSPNPASTQVTVEWKEDEIKEGQTFSNNKRTLEPYCIQIWREQTLVKSVDCTEEHIQISLENLQSGTYIVVAIQNGVIIGQQTLQKK